MKKILIATAFLFIISPVCRADSGLSDFGAFFAKARAGYSVNQHLEKSSVVYSSFERFHSLTGVEYFNMNFGYDMTNKHPLLMIGLRADNVAPLLWNGEWGRTHVDTANLPAIEFGPYASTWPYVKNGKVKADFFYGLIGAIGFGK